MTDKPKHISYSAISMLERCGEQYRFRYIEGISIPPGVSLLQGRAVDDAVTADLRTKIDSGVLLPLEAVRDIARDALVNAWDHSEVRLEAEYVEMGPAKAKAKAVDTSISLAELHHTEAAPKIEPTHVQREWALEVRGIPYPLVGVIDIQEGTKAVRDTKTSKKSPPKDAADKSSQLSAYALACKVRDGVMPEMLALDYLVATKTPKLVVLETKREMEQLRPFRNRLFNAVEVIQAGVFIPASPDAWCCSERWCGYWNTCRYAQRPVSVSVP
ncbi:MAG: RecB family exonuclease [Planctomycetota bacterium]|jgi:hypothetical protein